MTTANCAKTSLVMVGELNPRGTCVVTWRRQARPVEVAIFEAGDKYAWTLRVRGGEIPVDSGVEDSFRTAAESAEAARHHHVSVDWLRTW